MDSASLCCAKAINLCPRCMALFLAPKNDALLKLSEELVIDQIQKVMKTITPDNEDSWPENKRKNTICPCCFNSFIGNNIENLCKKIILDLNDKNIDLKRSVFLKVLIPPMIDTARITVRTIITKTNEKTMAFPTMSELVSRMAVESLRGVGLNIVSDVTVADFQVTISAAVPLQTKYLQSLYPEYKHKKKKRKFGEPASMDTLEVTRADADSVLISFKSFNTKEFINLEKCLIAYMATISGEECSLKWIAETIPSPIYLLGRYRKYARDVPQAPWTLGDERKGRNSVEEIITESVMKTLQGSSCKLHPCGREDIDVRCLGNGRPFILELSGSYALPSSVRMQEIISQVAARDPESLNREGDVDLLILKKSHRSVWESMQTVAEEKRKAYRCVCWSAVPIDEEKLKALESCSTSTDCTDEEGRPCLKLVQKTPLRVLHRRSLLDRVRYVYNIRTAKLNDHYFLMDLTTSAGTYVKEFVHGDLGRTVPSVCSLLNCQADILQLDVVWLFDDFEGGGDPPVGGDYSVGSGVGSIEGSSSSSGGKQTVPSINPISVGPDSHIRIANNTGHIDGENKSEGNPVAEVDEPSKKNEITIPSYSWSDLNNMKTIRQKMPAKN